tara:strand:+ start:264 stop:635 length:372 start_codon:yes stop_codon:yes gene_type:complete
MPTKKRRVGFIPRSDVLDLINKLSFESNLSISKIINILVEEALSKRGIFNKKNGKVYNSNESINIIKINNEDRDFKNKFNSFKNTQNLESKEGSDEFIDNEIYSKFLMFLHFQEKMKNNKLHS